MGEIQAFQTPLFSKIKKKLQKNQIKALDNAVREIIKNPELGEQKKGDLADVWVYKFRMVDRENLLAYQWDEKTRTLISLGVHENFYRDIKKYKNF
ncbi:MAG: type II toxin-antitoxin system RelE/ParE family toxin [Pseudanabaena sp.]